VRLLTQPEAYCAEMNCTWQGEVPAIAKCPSCGSRQVRTLTAERRVEILSEGLLYAETVLKRAAEGQEQAGKIHAAVNLQRSAARVREIAEKFGGSK
jgi:hypothetical protein